MPASQPSVVQNATRIGSALLAPVLCSAAVKRHSDLCRIVSRARRAVPTPVSALLALLRVQPRLLVTQ